MHKLRQAKPAAGLVGWTLLVPRSVSLARAETDQRIIMGHMRHDAIVVIGSEGIIIDAHLKAVNLSLNCTKPVFKLTNNYASFAVVPDGSKEGWDRSIACDEARENLVEWMRHEAHGFEHLEWIEISFGGDIPGIHACSFGNSVES